MGDRQGKAPGQGVRTRAVHAGGMPHPGEGPGQHLGSMTMPVFRTTAFTFAGVREMADAAAGLTDRFIYSRYDNPTQHEAEDKLAALEQAGPGAGAVALAAGMAAITAALLARLSSGEHLIAQRELYGGTTGLITRTLARLGIETTWLGAQELIGPGLEAALLGAGRETTRAVFLETPANPTLRVVDLAGVSAVARRQGWSVMVDNTFASPVNQLPLALGADVVLHSATKYLAGHSDLTAGFVLASGPVLERVRELRIDLGGCLDPSAAWLLSRSMKTLALRVAAQNDNAMAVARHLESHAGVSRVHYPGLAAHPGHEVAARQMSGFGGMLSFELEKPGDASRVIGALRMIRLAPTLGGIDTTASLPAFSSHVKLTAEERLRDGISEGLIRLSAGIEDSADILADLDGALG